MKIHPYVSLLPVAVVLAASAAALRADAPSAEDRLLDVLRSHAAVAEKANACRELKLVGTEKSIAVLAPLLGDAELSHPARFALESMPYPAAGAALRDALGKATGLARAGIIDSLGQRRDPAAVPLLAADLDAEDLTLVAAAATALGKIGTAESASLLTAARAKARGPARLKIDDGLLLSARRLSAGGKTAEADTIYGLLTQPGEPRQIRAGALRGRMHTAGPDRVRVVGESLADSNAMAREAAAAELCMLSDADLGAIAAHLADLPATSQVLGTCRDWHSRPHRAGAARLGGS